MRKYDGNTRRKEYMYDITSMLTPEDLKRGVMS